DYYCQMYDNSDVLF
nr:immunoglobulin light chain junction region [Macaca mulatta]MOV69147.1 immunoglobulin light chain junction region [Macaca mulatta]MOV69565.1 immunoglobulin light chain junction region [Macaca mulatta]MOV70335.1 immunoglobulin light chain junction region [Macaca mulatta]